MLVILDALSLAGVLTSLGAAGRNLIAQQRATGKTMRQLLAGLSRAERIRLARDLAKEMGTASTKRSLRRLVRAGRLSIWKAHDVTRAVHQQLLDAIARALSITASAHEGLTRPLVVSVSSD